MLTNSQTGSLQSVSNMMRNALAIGFIAFLAGCSPSGQVKTYPVKGTVKFEGKPMVGGGSISLIPLTEQPGKTAAGIIQADGTYVLETYKPGDGSMAGEFRVAIFQETVKEGKAAPDGSAPSATAATTVPVADRIPPAYADFNNSPLKTTVKTEPNVIDFDLKRQ